MRRKIEGYRAEVVLPVDAAEGDALADEQYEAVRRALHEYEDAVDPPLVIVLTRCSPDVVAVDKLPDELSVCRDAMIDVLGVAADHPAVSWQYRQRSGKGLSLVVEVRKLQAC